MPSSPYAILHSPTHVQNARHSRFTYRQFSQLATYTTGNPLRVVAHIDLDAFYAQCEMVRLGVSTDTPLAVQQWGGLIAVNYAARASGVSRFCDLTEARKMCPDLITQHVATWREGDDKWAYRPDASSNVATDKVSLDPYRLESRKILAVVKKSLPADLQKVEKASVDEVFLDLSAQIHSIMIERFPELTNPPPYDDPTENLPLPSIAALDWQADALVDLEEEQEALDHDWDDVVILLGSEIVRQVRAEIFQELHYTCSAGVANNKLVSKLGSAYKKPNSQTVIRTRAVETFLRDFSVTKMRNLGGKLGEQVVATFSQDTVKELLHVPLDEMKSKLGGETGQWVHNTIRGIDTSEVNSRTQIKSMLSAKSFRPYINNLDQGLKWLRIFAADIYTRLVEEGVLENKRRPRTMNLHHRHAGQMRSRQGPISQGKKIDRETLFSIAKDLLCQIVAEGNVWPCGNLSLSVAGFEEGIKGNMGIDAFVVRGDEASSLQVITPSTQKDTESDRPNKRRRADHGGIHRFLVQRASTDDCPEGEEVIDADVEEHGSPSLYPTRSDTELEEPRSGPELVDQPSLGQSACSKCQAMFDEPQLLQNHLDWHMAKDLQEEERVQSTFVERPAHARGSSPKGSSAPSRRGRGGKPEHGQSKLRFG